MCKKVMYYIPIILKMAKNEIKSCKCVIVLKMFIIDLLQFQELKY